MVYITLFLVYVIISNTVLNVPIARSVLTATIISLREITGGGRVVVGKGNARTKDQTFLRLQVCSF